MESPIAQAESPYEVLRRLENIVRVGVVAAVQHGKPARIRVRTGNITTNWLPWVAQRAGGRQRRHWWAPVAGEQCLLLAPGGDLLNAVALPGIYSDSNDQASTSATVERTDWSETEHAEHDSATGTYTMQVERSITLRINNGASIEMTRDSITLRAGGGSLVIDSAGVRGEPDVRSGSISLRTHLHTGVRTGTSNTGTPV
ncbi:phage baseplate assembly protein V [Acidovorax sp. GBBC 3334]|uniref:phage baseplate assembly protein V n=1 Tax=Acidovorax sp. GBBC 3334 TaxID=2940496 RepID=UPI002303E976|nr:phage baseplate assembly protein V [Acidovorax sp. GBBC 3334]MDA8455255.1 phage baseplate assembly protein V [Acidovorax sp. GBBC 3334]